MTYLFTINPDRCESNPLGSSPAQPQIQRHSSFYIDGFNLYHSICDLDNPKALSPIPDIKSLKWCDMYKLAESFNAKVKNSKLKDVFFFTATPHHREFDGKKNNTGQIERHINYCNALRHNNVKVIEGKFSHKKEKQTDTNLAVQVVSDILLNKIDSAFILSNDSDIIPIIKKILEVKPQTSISIIKPPSIKYTKSKPDGSVSVYETTLLSNDIKIAMNNYYKGRSFNRIYELKPSQLLQFTLPDILTDSIKNPYK